MAYLGLLPLQACLFEASGCTWSSLVEGDEGSNWPKGLTNFFFIKNCLDWFVILQTEHYLDQCKLSSPTTDLLGLWTLKGHYDGTYQQKVSSPIKELLGLCILQVHYDGTFQQTDNGKQIAKHPKRSKELPQMLLWEHSRLQGKFCQKTMRDQSQQQIKALKI